MSSKPVKSTDPRKAAVVAALKAKGGATKVTNVVEVGPGKFAADGMVRDPATRKGFKGTGRINVELPVTEPKRASGPKKLVAIQDACSKPGCYSPPTDTGYCVEHEKTQKPMAKKSSGPDTPTPPVRPAAGKKATKAKAAPIAEAVDIQKRFAKMVADMPAQAAADVVDAKRKAAKKAPAPKDNSLEARTAIATLLARGWTQAAIADELGTSVGRVWFWAHGANCRRIEDLRKLTTAPHPAVANHGKAPKAGALKVKVDKAARVNSRNLDDPRQLVLALRDAIEAAFNDVLSRGQK